MAPDARKSDDDHAAPPNGPHGTAEPTRPAKPRSKGNGMTNRLKHMLPMSIRLPHSRIPKRKKKTPQPPSGKSSDFVVPSSANAVGKVSANTAKKLPSNGAESAVAATMIGKTVPTATASTTVLPRSPTRHTKTGSSDVTIIRISKPEKNLNHRTGTRNSGSVIKPVTGKINLMEVAAAGVQSPVDPELEESRERKLDQFEKELQAVERLQLELVADVNRVFEQQERAMEVIEGHLKAVDEVREFLKSKDTMLDNAEEAVSKSHAQSLRDVQERIDRIMDQCKDVAEQVRKQKAELADFDRLTVSRFFHLLAAFSLDILLSSIVGLLWLADQAADTQMAASFERFRKRPCRVSDASAPSPPPMDLPAPPTLAAKATTTATDVTWPPSESVRADSKDG